MCSLTSAFHGRERTVPSTEFRALWDDELLHFRFDCHDDDLVLAEGDSIKERVLGSDRVEIFLTPDLSLTPYYCFEMSPRGEVQAYRARYHRRIDWDWTCPDFQISACIEAPHYRVEGSLPLARLRALNILKPGSHEFYAGVYRGEFSHLFDDSVHHGWMPWVNPQTEKPDFHVPESFGVFVLQG
ncbi:MAG: sugar-binding protein, partial [Prosthecobacter sp.]